MKRITVIAMIGLLTLSGCSVFNWDATSNVVTRLGPGAQAKGKSAKVEYRADGTVVAEADTFTDGDREYPGEVEVRKDVNVNTKTWSSDYDFVRMGSQKDIKTEMSVNSEGEVNTGASQEPHGLTMLEWLLVGAAVIIGPMLLGGIATAVGFPAIGSVLTLISPISWLGKLKGLIPTTTTTETIETKETENASNS